MTHEPSSCNYVLCNLHCSALPCVSLRALLPLSRTINVQPIASKFCCFPNGLPTALVALETVPKSCHASATCTATALLICCLRRHMPGLAIAWPVVLLVVEVAIAHLCDVSATQEAEVHAAFADHAIAVTVRLPRVARARLVRTPLPCGPLQLGIPAAHIH
jgi:hypothetical protein